MYHIFLEWKKSRGITKSCFVFTDHPQWLEDCLLLTESISLRLVPMTLAWTCGEERTWRSLSGFVKRSMICHDTQRCQVSTGALWQEAMQGRGGGYSTHAVAWQWPVFTQKGGEISLNHKTSLCFNKCCWIKIHLHIIYRYKAKQNQIKPQSRWPVFRRGRGWA